MPWRWILALVWLIAWSLAARGFWGASAEQNAEADRIGLPLTGVEPGADVRVEATVARGPKVQSAFSKREGVAVLLDVTYVTTYLDSQDKTAFDSATITTRTQGPSELALEASGQRFFLPMDRFAPDVRYWVGEAAQLDKLPPDLHVSPDDVEQAKKRCRGQFHHYGVHEWVVEEGMLIFVAGHLSPRDPANGKVLLGKDPVLDKIELVPGTQAAAVVRRRGSSAGLRVAGWIVLGLGFLPGLIFAILLVRSKLRPKSAAGTV